MQPTQFQQSRTLEEIKSYYSHLWHLCDKPEENFDEIQAEFSQIKQVSNEEYIWICRCAEAIIKSRDDQNKCIKLLDTLPWQIKSFQQTRSALPLLHAAVAGMKFEIVDYLIKVRKTSPNAINNVGETPLHIAAESGGLQQSLDMTEFLLQRGADPRKKAKILSHHPNGTRVIDYWPEKSMFNSDAELDKVSLAILNQAAALLSEYTKRWEEGKIVPSIAEEEQIKLKQEKATLLKRVSNFSQGLFSLCRQRKFRQNDYIILASQEDTEGPSPTLGLRRRPD